MSEVVAKPLKSVLISRKLAFVVAATAAVGLVLVMAWSEQSHKNKVAEQSIEEKEKLAKELAEKPTGNELESVLQIQKTEAERKLEQPAVTEEPHSRFEASLNEEINRTATPVDAAGPTPEEIRRAKEEELAMSAYGSDMVALKRNAAVSAVSGGIEDVVAGVSKRQSGADEKPSLPPEDMAMLRDAQRPSVQTHQDRNRSFLSTVVGRQGEIFVESGRTERILHEGSVIPAVVTRAINSDLPGQVELRTTRDVYDSVHAKTLVIPRGTRAIGSYSSDINAGQDRVLVVFNRLIFPDGRNVYLGNAQGADREGASGFKDKVNTHYWTMLGSSFLLAAISRLAEGDNNTTVNIGGSSGGSSNSAGQIMADTSRTVLGRYTNMQPTIEIRPGTRVNILVNKDIVL